MNVLVALLLSKANTFMTPLQKDSRRRVVIGFWNVFWGRVVVIIDINNPTQCLHSFFCCCLICQEFINYSGQMCWFPFLFDLWIHSCSETQIRVTFYFEFPMLDNRMQLNEVVIILEVIMTNDEAQLVLEIDLFHFLSQCNTTCQLMTVNRVWKLVPDVFRWMDES